MQVETRVLGSIKGYGEFRRYCHNTLYLVEKCYANQALGMASSFSLEDSHNPGDMILERNSWRATPKILLHGRVTTFTAEQSSIEVGLEKETNSEFMCASFFDVYKRFSICQRQR